MQHSASNQSSTLDKSSYAYLETSTIAQHVTRLAFFLAGFSMAVWAPLVPFAKLRLQIGESALGTLLLALGGGSVLAMPIAGYLIEKLGCRIVITLGLFGAVLILPFLVLSNTMLALALTLAALGASLSLVDISMNTQAVVLEKASGKVMMSGMHAFWSIGGIAGAGLVSLLLWLKITPIYSVLTASVMVLILFIPSIRFLLPKADAHPDDEKTPLFVVPKGMVLLIGVLCFILFLAEGSLLDWSALFLKQVRDMPENSAGIGYVIFSVAMTIGRLTGDKIIHHVGRYKVLMFGSLAAAAGYLIAITVPSALAALAGFLLVGLGASNTVPILFTAAGNQKSMPPRLAIASIAMVGYAGMLVGPAGIGWISQHFGLQVAFSLICILLLFVTFNSRKVTQF